MKKLILILWLIPFVLSAQTKLTYKTSEVQTLLDKSKNSQLGVFNVLDYGATSDSTVNYATALQNTFDAVALTGGTVDLVGQTYLFKSTLYVYGNVNIINGTLKPRMSSDSWCSIALGAKKNTVSGNYVWSGVIDEVKFDCGGNTYNGNIINVFRGNNYAIRNCKFIEPYNTSIKGLNNGAFATDNLIRKNGLYENNYIEVITTTPIGEGISINATASGYVTQNMRFIKNIIYGVYDDMIATHGECSDIIISNNVCKGSLGKILIHDSKNVLISENNLQHTTDYGWFIDVDTEIVASAQCENIRIANNQIVTPSTGGVNTTYMIRAKGTKNLTIEGNDLINNYPDNTLLRVVDIADTKNRKSNNISITNNKIKNGYIQFGSITDTSFTCMNNTIDSGYVYFYKHGGYIKNNAIIPHKTIDYIYNGETQAINETKIAEFYVTLPSASTFTMILPNGGTSYKIAHNFQITNYKISLSAAFSTGWIDLIVKVNGTQKDDPIGQDNTYQYYTMIPPPTSILLKTGNLLTITGGTTNATDTNGKILTVEVFGAYTKN